MAVATLFLRVLFVPTEGVWMCFIHFKPDSPSLSGTLSWECCWPYIIFWKKKKKLGLCNPPLNSLHLTEALHSHKDAHMGTCVHTQARALLLKLISAHVTYSHQPFALALAHTHKCTHTYTHSVSQRSGLGVQIRD